MAVFIVMTSSDYITFLSSLSSILTASSFTNHFLVSHSLSISPQLQWDKCYQLLKGYCSIWSKTDSSLPPVLNQLHSSKWRTPWLRCAIRRVVFVHSTLERPPGMSETLANLSRHQGAFLPSQEEASQISIRGHFHSTISLCSLAYITDIAGILILRLFFFPSFTSLIVFLFLFFVFLNKTNI